MVKKEELSEEEKKEIIRKYSLSSLNNEYILNLAVIGFNQVPEGRLSPYGTVFSGLYELVTNSAPDPHSWERLYKNALQKGGSIDKSKLIEGAARDIEESILSVKINDLFDFMGSEKRVNRALDGKFISDLNLPDEEIKDLKNDCISTLVSRKARGMLSLRESEGLNRFEKKYAEAA